MFVQLLVLFTILLFLSCFYYVDFALYCLFESDLFVLNVLNASCGICAMGLACYVMLCMCRDLDLIALVQMYIPERCMPCLLICYNIVYARSLCVLDAWYTVLANVMEQFFAG